MALTRGELTRQFQIHETLADFAIEADAIASPGEASERIFARLSEQKRAREVDEELHGAKSGSKSSHIDRTAEASKNDEKGAARRREEQAYIDLIAAMSAEELGDWLDVEIGKTRKAAEAAQAQLVKAQEQRDSLDSLAILIDTGEFDPLNPDHEALYQRTNLRDITGASTAAEFVQQNPTKELQKEAIQEGRDAADAQIAELVERVDSLLGRLDILTQAQAELLQNMDNPEVVQEIAQRVASVVEQDETDLSMQIMMGSMKTTGEWQGFVTEVQSMIEKGELTDEQIEMIVEELEARRIVPSAGSDSAGVINQTIDQLQNLLNGPLASEGPENSPTLSPQ